MPKKDDKWLFLAVIIIGIFGIVMIYSASFIWAEYKFNDPFKFVKAQSAFFIIGLFLMFVLRKINPKIYYDLSGFVPLNKKDFMLMFHMIMVRKSYYIGITNGLKR